MLALAQDHVADSGVVYCGWRRERLTIAACEKCPAFKEKTLRAVSTAHPIEIVRCTEPIPLA